MEYRADDTQPIYLDFPEDKIMTPYENALYKERYEAEQRAKVLAQNAYASEQNAVEYEREPSFIENSISLVWSTVCIILMVVYSFAFLWELFITGLGGFILVPSALAGRSYEANIFLWMVTGLVVTGFGIWGAVSHNEGSLVSRLIKSVLVILPLAFLYSPIGAIIFHR